MEPYIGEIRLFAGNFAPLGWMFCSGQLLPISEYETLFQLIGTTYGGDGSQTFALPNLQGRVPVHQGPNYVLGQAAGSEAVTLTAQTTPTHSHPFMTSNGIANSPNPGNNVLGISSQVQMFFGDPPNQPMNSTSVTVAGGSQPHDNMMPFLCLNYIISLYGIWPSQN